MLSAHERTQFSQQIVLDDIGLDGQTKLKDARVLCVGAGGLGTPVCLYLASAGIGTLGIIDGDRIALNNLPRQIIYGNSDVGASKVVTCRDRLLVQSPHCHVEAHDIFLNEDNALNLIAQYDMIVDCSDNFATRYLVNDACCELDKYLISASIHQFSATCAVFPGKGGPCYRCLFESAPNSIQNCSEAGILNTVAGITGTIQAHEVIKVILGMQGLVGQVLSIDLRSMIFNRIQLPVDPHCVICSKGQSFTEVIRMNQSCSSGANVITYTDYLAKQPLEGAMLIDVRTVEEFQVDHVSSAVNMPLDSLTEEILSIDKNTVIFLYCRSGCRSQQAGILLKQLGYASVYDIEGGLLAIREIEPIKGLT